MDVKVKPESKKNNFMLPLYASVTAKGSVKPLNEDHVYCDENISLIADGMGGHEGGDIASKTAVTVITTEYQNHANLVNAIMQAHLTITQLNSGVDAKNKMGTTIVATITASDTYQIAWVGDSRAYLWQNQAKLLTLLTKDHSLINRLIDNNSITLKQAKQHPQKHMLTQGLGLSTIDDLVIDTVENTWLANQQLLLCSDGLSSYVSTGIITHILSQTVSKQQKLTLLVDAANQKGGQDNISMVLIDSPISLS
jgi:serine/threonine protein phosphatase PrpC